jgi:hypothetical protein
MDSTEKKKGIKEGIKSALASVKVHNKKWADYHKKQVAELVLDNTEKKPTRTIKSTGLSNCCKAEAIVAGDECTSHYECTFCGEACDIDQEVDERIHPSACDCPICESKEI